MIRDHDKIEQLRNIQSGKWYVVFVDGRCNFRRTKKGLLLFEKRLVDEGRLFWTTGLINDTLRLTTNKGNHILPLRRIPEDEYYISHLKVKNEDTGEYDWSDNLKITNIINVRLESENKSLEKIDSIEDVEVEESGFA